MTQVGVTSIHILLLLLSTASTVQASNPAGFTIETGVDPSILPHLSGFSVFPTSRLQRLAITLVGGTDIQVTFDPANMPQNEPTIAVNPLNSSRLSAGANDYRLAAQGLDAWTGIYLSQDGGSTWTNGLLPGYPGGPISSLTGFDTAGDPALAYDKNGNIYYAGLAANRAGDGGARDGTVFVSKSSDGGNTFSTVIIARGSGNTFNDKPYLAVDTTNASFSGRVYVSFSQFKTTTGKIFFSFSNNGGETFSPPALISDSNINQGSIPAVGPNGEVYITWRDISNTQVKVAKSTDGGISFSSAKVVANIVPIPNPLPNTNFRTNTNPTMTVDSGSGKIYIGWNDYRNGNADIFLSQSTDSANTFNTPVRINDDTGNHDQFFPWLQTAPGRLSAIFYDRRLDASNHDLDVFYTESRDGGATFTQNQRVSDQSIDPDIQFQGQFIGDYIGLALTSTNAHPAWTDSRNLNQDVFTDKIATVVHDVAVAGLSVSPILPRAGQPVSVTVIAANEGTVAENFTLTLSVDSEVLGVQTVTNLAGGSSKSLLFSWNSTGAGPRVYVIRAVAGTVEEETDTLDNSRLATLTVTVTSVSPVGGSRPPLMI